MAITTVIVLPELRNREINLEVASRVTELENAGVILGTMRVKNNGLKCIRTWANEVAAHDWISYQYSLVPPPVSAVVVID
jgi:hypothetical protein